MPLPTVVKVEKPKEITYTMPNGLVLTVMKTTNGSLDLRQMIPKALLTANGDTQSWQSIVADIAARYTVT